MSKPTPMPARAYTPRELDDLRRVVSAKWLYGRYQPRPGTHSRHHSLADLAVSVEEMVRTHMMAGHTAEMLVASELPKAA